MCLGATLSLSDVMFLNITVKQIATIQSSILELRNVTFTGVQESEVGISTAQLFYVTNTTTNVRLHFIRSLFQRLARITNIVHTVYRCYCKR
jgi:hypothetical protein